MARKRHIGAAAVSAVLVLTSAVCAFAEAETADAAQ
jgi:hypothetical protein